MRQAGPRDLDTILRLIHALAEYENQPEAVHATRDGLQRHLFGAHRFAEVLLAETESGENAGFALYFHTYSTWEGRPGLWLEDLFVRDEYRREGYGLQLLSELARIAIDRGCARLEWAVLDWNDQAIAFYESLGATALDEWTTYRLTGDPLHQLAEG